MQKIIVLESFFIPLHSLILCLSLSLSLSAKCVCSLLSVASCEHYANHQIECVHNSGGDVSSVCVRARVCVWVCVCARTRWSLILLVFSCGTGHMHEKQQDGKTD